MLSVSRHRALAAKKRRTTRNFDDEDCIGKKRLNIEKRKRGRGNRFANWKCFKQELEHTFEMILLLLSLLQSSVLCLCFDSRLDFQSSLIHDDVNMFFKASMLYINLQSMWLWHKCRPFPLSLIQFLEFKCKIDDQEPISMWW